MGLSLLEGPYPRPYLGPYPGTLLGHLVQARGYLHTTILIHSLAHQVTG